MASAAGDGCHDRGQSAKSTAIGARKGLLRNDYPVAQLKQPAVSRAAECRDELAPPHRSLSKDALGYHTRRILTRPTPGPGLVLSNADQCPILNRLALGHRYESGLQEWRPNLTSAECRTRAEQKIPGADRDPRHRRRLLDAAQAWLILASRMRR